LGLRENAAQFSLLVLVNAFVGAMVGLERSTLPLVGRQDFHLASSVAVLSFIVAFGVAKALTNLMAGALAQRAGRRRLLIAGWAAALPVPLLIALAPNWGWIVAANALLGINQGLAWSMTVVMKIDLVGPRRRGLALGLNESAGYGGVALAAGLSGWLAASFAARDVLVAAGAAIALIALLLSVLFVRDTGAHVALEQARDHAGATGDPPPLRRAFAQATYRKPALRSCSQAGLVNNLNDALAWGLVPLYLAAHGASVSDIGLVAAIYPGVWSVAQIATGHWSDNVGRKPLIAAGMLVQAAALGLLALGNGRRSSASGGWHCARIPDPDRRDVRHRHPRSARARSRGLPLLARQRLRLRRPDRRRRRRRTRLRRRDHPRRRAHRRLRPMGALRHARAPARHGHRASTRRGAPARPDVRRRAGPDPVSRVHATNDAYASVLPHSRNNHPSRTGDVTRIGGLGARRPSLLYSRRVPALRREQDSCHTHRATCSSPHAQPAEVLAATRSVQARPGTGDASVAAYP
jgi:MFS family permease